MATQVAAKERPILFSGSMVQAILEGRKTQTRRILKHKTNLPLNGVSVWHQDSGGTWIGWFENRQGLDEFTKKVYAGDGVKCPCGQVGDRLWVRETWRPALTEDEHECFAYRATMSYRCNKPMPGDWEGMVAVNGGWKPSIHMPRKASRIILEVTNIRVERLQDISEEDAIAEGIESRPQPESPFSGCWKDYQTKNPLWYGRPLDSFRSLWNSINSDRGYSWESNPWVWVVEFKKVDPANTGSFGDRERL